MFHIGLYLDNTWQTVASTKVYKRHLTSYLTRSQISELLEGSLDSTKRELSHFEPNKSTLSPYPNQLGRAYAFRGYQAHSSYWIKKGDGICHALILTMECA